MFWGNPWTLSYAYFRIYQKDALCLIHSDRAACDHGIDLGDNSSTMLRMLRCRTGLLPPRHDPGDAVRFGAWLSAWVDPVRTGADAARGQGRCARYRFWQYRRDECAAHREQGACRADAHPRLPQGNCCHPDSVEIVWRGDWNDRGRRRFRRASLPGLA